MKIQPLAARLLVAPLLIIGLMFATCSAHADEVAVAVAANFAGAAHRLSADFERASGHRLIVSVGATGKLYAQIAHGAPFDVLLAADQDTPRKLEHQGLAVIGTRFTYAVGQLVLWSPDATLIDARGDVLRTGNFTHLAIANPKTAPYGAAAEQTLRKLGVMTWTRLTPRLVYGENIAQTFQFVTSGNAAAGFVALSQLKALPPSQRGSQWLVPQELYEPLRQDAVLLKRAADKPAARAFLDYLRGPTARSIIEGFGYTMEP